MSVLIHTKLFQWSDIIPMRSLHEFHKISNEKVFCSFTFQFLNYWTDSNKFSTRWRWVVSFMPQPLYPEGNSPWYPLDRRLDGTQSLSGRSGEEKNSQPPLGTTASRTALGPTQHPIQWVPGALYLAVQRPGREAVNSPLFSAEVKEWVELHLHSPIRPHGVVLS
jgi:hypothetical protein